MAAYNNMGQGELRRELTSRGLTVYGKVDELRERLRADDARGIFNGSLENMGKKDLENVCQNLNIPSAGKLEVLINRIEEYNLRKSGGQRGAEEAEESLNTGLPTPEDQLGPQTGESILGTPASGLYHGPYTRYLEHYERVNGTTENAFTLRYWRILQNPGVPIGELWPIHIEYVDNPDTDISFIEGIVKPVVNSTLGTRDLTKEELDRLRLINHGTKPSRAIGLSEIRKHAHPHPWPFMRFNSFCEHQVGHLQKISWAPKVEMVF